MWYLFSQIFGCLCVVAILSFALGWFLRSKLSKAELKRLENIWKINVLSKDMEKEKTLTKK